MEINVLNIKGENTGRKVTLNESIFGIEPNDHVLYLDVKRYMAAQRQGQLRLKKEVSMQVQPASLAVRRVAVALVAVTSILRCS